MTGIDFTDYDQTKYINSTADDVANGVKVALQQVATYNAMRLVTFTDGVFSLPNDQPFYIQLSVAGEVDVETEDGRDTVPLVLGYHSAAIKKIYEAGTAATGIVACWNK